MSDKSMIMLGLLAGSLAGGYLPTLFGAGSFSLAAWLGSGIGGITGILLMYRLTR